MNESSPEAAPLILLKDVHLKLASPAGEVNILRGISLNVPPGETLGVIGPSGSGKTTMLMIMAGLEKPTSGQVCIAGHDLERLSEDKLALFRRDNVGIVFQAFHLVPTMTALENVAVPLELAGRRDAFQRAKELLQMVGLGARLGHYPAQLSGGEQQRVALARSFSTEPRLLLADEPTGNLDAGTGEHIIELLFGLHAHHGTTLVLITHDPELAARCDRAVHLHDGRIIEEADLRQLRQ